MKTTTAAAELGTELHETLIPAWIRGRLPDTPRGRALERVSLDVSSPELEAAFGVNLESWDAVRVLPAHHRDYSQVPRGWLAGTADVVTSDRTVEFKFGAVEQPPPQRHPQMWLIALGRWLIDPRDRAEMVLVHVRPPDRSGRCWATVRRHKPTLGDLHRWRESLLDALRRVEHARESGAQGEGALMEHLAIGDHCSSCPALLSCPAIETVIGHGEPAEDLLLARARLKAAERRLALVESALAGFDLLETEDGRSFVRHTGYKRRLTARALEVYPELRAHVRVPLVGDLDDFIRASRAPGQTIKERREEVEARLVELGGLDYVASERFTEVFE